MNGAKTFFYMVLMTLLLVAVGAAFDARFHGGGSYTRFMFMIALAMNLFTYWFADTIVLKMHGAREVSPEEQPRLHAIVDRLTARSHIPKPKVCVVPAEVPNAFATGRNHSHSAVAVTGGLMRILNDEELEGVIAHEMAHIKHYDMLLNTMIAVAAGLIGMMSMHARWGMLFGGRSRDNSSNPLALLSILFVAILAPLLSLVIHMMISRQREFAADAGGAKICGNPRALASALVRIERQASGLRDLDWGSQATSHLYFINHFSLAGASRLLSSHPPTQERVARLLAMAESGRMG